MKEHILSIILLLFTVAAEVHPQSAHVQGKHAAIELLFTRSYDSRDPLLGVHFVLEKGWHIYWINPGDSGQPPSFNWHLPAGVSPGEVLWPRPDRLQSSPSIADYGYQDDVLFMLPLHARDSAKPNWSGEVAVDVKWLICREVCIPDHASLKLSTGPEANASTRDLFAKAKKLVPRPWPRKWRARAESRKSDLLLTIETGTTLSHAEFFPLDAGQIENAAKQRVQPTAQGARITLQKSDLLVNAISRLRGVLVIPGRGAYQVQAPVALKVALK
jgi:thiol:disulfide interchange protein DsbD